MSYQTSIKLSSLPVGTENSVLMMQKKVIDLTTAYTEAWENNDYEAVREFASQFYGMGTDVLNRIKLLTYYGARDRALADKEDASLTKVMKELAADNSPEAMEKKAAMLTQFQEQLGKEKGQAAYDSMLDGTHPIFDQAITQSKQTDSQTEFLGGVYVAVLTSAVAADYIGYLRTGLDYKAPIPVTAKDTEFVNELTATLNTIQAEAYNAIYNALKTDQAADELLALAISYQDQLKSLFGISGALLGPYLASIRVGSNLTEHYQAALGLSEASNKSNILFAYLSYLRANLSDRNYKKWLSNERKRTDNRTNTSNVDQGTPVSIQDLTSIAQDVEEGTLVQIEGIVTSIGIKDDPEPPKFSTFVTLTDLASNASIKLRAHMFGLEDNGVAVGSYMRMNGFVRRNESWLAQDETGLDFDRVNLGEIASSNWLDDIVRRMKMYYPLYQDGMNTFFTLN